MKLRRQYRRLAAVGIAVSVTLGFYAADMIGASDLNWRAWLAAITGADEPAADTSEIRNYVEFVTIDHNGLTITTGTEFASSYVRQVSGQWCYVHRAKQISGAAEYRLNLATIDGAGIRTLNLFTPANLEPLGLSQDQAHALIKTYCRFR